MTHLEDYDLKVVNITAPQENRFQYTDDEIKKLEDPKIKAFFIVNPGNPTGMAMSRETIGKIVEAGEDQAPRPDAADGRRVRNVRRRFPLAARRAAAQHDRRLFLFEVFRLHRLAARRHRDPRGQHLRQDDRQAAGRACEGAGQALRPDHARAAQDQVHRSHRRRQPRHRPQPHRRAFAAAAGDDDDVLALRDDGCEEGLSEGLHGDRPPARHGR